MSAPEPLASAPRDLFAAVGNTPLLALPRLSGALGRTVLAKAEFMNPGGSVKDRAARAILVDAEARGVLTPGSGQTVVEGTGGNTGIALALLGRSRGYRTELVVPDNQSTDKFQLFEALGVRVHVAPSVAFTDERHYYHAAKRRAAEVPQAFFADQFENPANRRAHLESTGPEIWAQAGGRLDAFVAAVGTGGTFSGTAAYLKSRDARVRCVAADCAGSSIFSLVTHGTMEAEGESILEGIGIRRLTANFAGALADDALRISDADAVAMTRWLLDEEGLFVGGSAALNVLAAARLSRALPEGAVVVTLLCDGGGRYQSRLFDAGWLRERGLPHAPLPIKAILDGLAGVAADGGAPQGQGFG